MCFIVCVTGCVIVCELAALWLLPRDNHYGGGPQSGEIDIAELLGKTVAIRDQFGLGS